MMTGIERIHEIEMTAGDEAEIAALLALCFDSDFGGRSFYRTRHNLRLVLREGGAIVAHMALQYRAVRLGGRLITVAALAEVATHPGCRGRGLAAGLLQAAIAEARASQAAYFLLFGDAALYAAAGFAEVQNPMIYVEMDGAQTGDVKREAAEVLQVLAMGAQPWDGAAELDVMGALF